MLDKEKDNKRILELDRENHKKWFYGIKLKL
jgi:hypothetical protein